MKKIVFLALLSILSFNSYSQIKFEKGYFINNNDEKTECLIKNLDSKDTPQEFEYKSNANSEIKKLAIQAIKEFAIYDYASYQRFVVDIDRSSEVTANLNDKRNPIFEKDTLFLENIIKGEANLYMYLDEKGFLRRFFLQKERCSNKAISL